MAQYDDAVLHEALPEGQLAVAAARLPSMRPVSGAWLRCDAAYAAQMVLRRRLLATLGPDVYAQTPAGVAAARAFLRLALADLPAGFTRSGEDVRCPDGGVVTLNWDAPLWSVGHVFQQDVCILEKHEDEHVLSGAVLCFPASWTLAQKIGKPLTGIHRPVPEYEDQIARRVQRMFDGVQPGQPLWRANALRYEDPALYQPRREGDHRPIAKHGARFVRSERQTVLRLPHESAVAFMIHTMVIEDPAADLLKEI